MSRDEMAFAIFLKRIASEPLNDTNRRGVESKACEAYEIADVFLETRNAQRAAKDVPEDIL